VCLFAFMNVQECDAIVEQENNFQIWISLDGLKKYGGCLIGEFQK